MTIPVVSIVTVAYGGGWAWVPRALEALRRNTDHPYEVIVVDNGGADDRPLPDDSTVRVVRNETNVGFGPGSNQGAACARADVLCFLNTDTLVEPGWLAPLLDRLRDDAVGAVFPAKLNEDGSLQEAGAFVTRDAHAHVFGDGDDPDAPEHGFSRDVDFGSAACMAMTRRRFDAAGGFDPKYRIAYYEDADLCFRLREQQLRVFYEPRSRVTHARTVSAAPSALAGVYSANRDVFLSRWSSALEERPGLVELQADGALQLAARDFHASDRILLLGSLDAEARRLATALAAAPQARVTLLAAEADAPFARELLAGGVEVVAGVSEVEWLRARTGHYSQVAARPDSRWLALRTVVRATQPNATLVDFSPSTRTPG